MFNYDSRKLTHFAFPGKRGNCIFAIIPLSIKFVENEGEAGASLDHGNPKKKKKNKTKTKTKQF